MTLEALQAQVLGLPRSDRSQLLDRLMASLDVDAEGEEQWEQLADGRDRAYQTGQVDAVSMVDAMARLRARFPG